MFLEVHATNCLRHLLMALINGFDLVGVDVGVWDGDNYDATINMVISYLWSYHNNLTIICINE